MDCTANEIISWGNAEGQERPLRRKAKVKSPSPEGGRGRPTARAVGPGVREAFSSSAEVLLPWNWFLGVIAGPLGSDSCGRGGGVGDWWGGHGRGVHRWAEG